MEAKEGITGTHTVPPMARVVVGGPLPPLPDLIVSDISKTWVEEGKTYSVTFTVKN